MADGQTPIQDWILRIVGALGALGIGSWFLTWRKQHSEDRHKTTEQEFGHQRTIVQEYQAILNQERDRWHKEREEERKRWGDERSELDTEATTLRRRIQRYMVEMEGMRLKIENQEREIATLTGTEGQPVLGDRFDPVLICNNKGDIYWCNESASMFLGYPIDMIYSMNMESFIPNEQKAIFRQNVAKHAQAPPARRGEIIDYVVRGRTLIRDGTEVPTDVVVAVYSIADDSCPRGVTVRRYQIRRRYDRVAAEDSDASISTYIPHQLSSGSNIGQMPVIDTTARKSGEAPARPTKATIEPIKNPRQQGA